MAAHQIAFDESGNTGGHLLDKEQPAFVLASVHVDHERATEMVEVARGNAPEAHFVNMRRSANGRDRILDVLNADGIVGNVRLSMYHKPFMVTTKIIDLLIMTMADEDGYDFYERGGNIGMANLWHSCFPTIIGQDRFDELHRLFVDFVRNDSWPLVMKFHRFVEALYREFEGKDWEVEFGLLFAASQRIGWHDYRSWDDSDLDPGYPAFVDLGSYWTGELGEPFDILHDQSRLIANEQERLEHMMSVTDPTATIGYDRRKMNFPIKATGINLVDSADHPDVQLADIIASAAAFGLKKKIQGKSDSFVDQLLQSPTIDGQHGLVWPSLAVTPEELGTEEVGGINAHEYIAKYLSEAEAKATCSN